MKTKSYGFTRLNFTPKNFNGFTIVELLVVIVVIGILAAITIVSYTGISHKAEISSLQSDLANSSKQLNIFQAEKSTYPATVSTNCSTNPTDATNLCIKTSSTNTYGYKYYSPNSYMLVSMNGNTCYSITNNSTPVENCVTIGTQTWMKYNLDVGERIDATIAQTNNSVVEKWCYNNDPVNCTTYGGLYQWGETVQYQDGASNTTSPSPAFSTNVQGIAPAGFHIPSDAEWKTLEKYLGMTQEQADMRGWRVTTEGDQLKGSGLCQGRNPCATIGLNGLLGGRNNVGNWYELGSYGYIWSSSQRDASNAWDRHLGLASAFAGSGYGGKTDSFSVRCLKN